MASSEAQKRASIKWAKQNYEKIELTYKKGFKDILKKNAESLGLSPSQMMRDAINEYCVKNSLPLVF